MKISGNIVDVLNNNIYYGTIEIANSKIVNITKGNSKFEIRNSKYIIPGFIDAHVHIESSMLVPYEFARLALPHGTVATVSDPHEIGNVLGNQGVDYMLENAKDAPLKFYFGAPSCVPATIFETAGAEINIRGIEKLFENNEIKYLSEMMNFPGVLSKDPLVMAKIKLAKDYGKQVDGHAPGLRGKDAENYIKAGITTDHECFTKEEALEKLKYGMKIIIREGSAAKNFDALIPLLDEHFENIMFCSDDKHPDSLEIGHIDRLVKRAVDSGNDVMKALQCACVNPVKHYGLEVGLLQPGDPADFIEIDNLKDFSVLKTFINGELVAEKGRSFLPQKTASVINNFNTNKKKVTDFLFPVADGHVAHPDIIGASPLQINVIEALDGQLITNKLTANVKIENGNAVSDIENDVLKLAVINRYSDARPAIAFIKNFGFKKGAIASSVAHDSHNVIAVGVDDENICKAVNLVIEQKGGLSVAANDIAAVLPLPIAGLMTNENGYKVSARYTKLDKLAKELGSTLKSPFMTLSFMALLVIPEIKLSDKGLFDGGRFEFMEVFKKLAIDPE
ncbi:MAG: adenine deaminase [Cytophagales bacterium]|nr:adenine deaminase [Cytophagales bacterium]